MLPPQWELDFDKITVFRKTSKTHAPGHTFGTQNDLKSMPWRSKMQNKCPESVDFKDPIFDDFLGSQKALLFVAFGSQNRKDAFHFLVIFLIFFDFFFRLGALSDLE